MNIFVTEHKKFTFRVGVNMDNPNRDDTLYTANVVDAPEGNELGITNSKIVIVSWQDDGMYNPQDANSTQYSLETVTKYLSNGLWQIVTMSLD
jgi:hypothetical protein